MDLPINCFFVDPNSHNISIQYTLSNFDKVYEYKDVLCWSTISASSLIITVEEQLSGRNDMYLTEEFMLHFRSHINWNTASRCQKFSLNFLLHFHHLVNMNYISRLRDFTNHEYEMLKDVINWKIICECKDLKITFIQQYSDYVDWKTVFVFQSLTEEFIENNIDKVDNYLLKVVNTVLSEDFLLKYKHLIDWQYFLARYSFSEDFLNQIPNYLDWYVVSLYQILTENFIRQNKENVNWRNISERQYLSSDFIIEFENYLDWDCLVWKQTLPLELIERFEDKIDFEALSEFQKLPQSFLQKNLEYLYLDKVTARGLPGRNNDNTINYFAQYPLTPDFVWENRNYMDWPGICAFQSFTEDFFERVHLEVNYRIAWAYLFKYQKKGFSKSFLIKYLKHVSNSVKDIALGRYLLGTIWEIKKMPEVLLEVVYGYT